MSGLTTADYAVQGLLIGGKTAVSKSPWKERLTKGGTCKGACPWLVVSTKDSSHNPGLLLLTVFCFAFLFLEFTVSHSPSCPGTAHM